MANQEHLDILKQGIKVWNNWRSENPAIEPDLMEADLKEVNFKKEYSSLVVFRGADLRGANLRGADLSGAFLYKADLRGADLSGADLQRASLQEADLREANLSVTNLYRAFLYKADLSEVNLSEAFLVATQAIETNFQGATLTEVCIENWNINSQTNLNDVICDCIYLKRNQQERRPHDPNNNFAAGDFANLVQKALNTVDLIFSDGINWQAFLTSFQKLQVECESDELAIQAIENKSGGAFVIRVEVPLDVNKAEVEKYLLKEYEIQLKAIEDKYRLELNAKNEKIEIYKQKSADIMELAKLAASRPINISQTQGNNMAGDRNIHMGSGNYNERIEGNYVQGNYYAAGEKQNLAEAAAEIQALLKQLEQSYPANTTSDQMVIAAKAIESIESNPNLKQRVISAVKEGGIAAFEKAIDNPVGAFIAGAVKGWQEVK
jgi:hypothetical protein